MSDTHQLGQRAITFKNIRSRLYGKTRVYAADIYVDGCKLGSLEDSGTGSPSELLLCHPELSTSLDLSIRQQFCGTEAPPPSASEFFNTMLRENDERCEALIKQQRAARAAQRKSVTMAHWA